jgi:hypothetical protein
MMMTGAEVHQ